MNQTTRIELLIVISILLAGYFGFNNVIGLRAEEPRRAVVGIECYQGGNPLIPTIHGEPYYNKPPVYNWVLASGFLITGSYSPFMVRLPGVLSLWIIAFLIYGIVKRNKDSQTGIIAALVFLTFGDLFYYGAINSGEIDLFYSLVVFIQVISIFYFYQKKKYLLLFGVSYLLTAIGFLTKGLPSLAFQGLTLLSYFLWNREFKKLFSIEHLVGIAVFASPILAYFLFYDESENARGFLLNLWAESSSKSANETSGSVLLESLYSFPIQLIKVTLPWSLFVIGLRKKVFKSSPLLQFSLIFILANVWLYWIAPELRNRYLYAFFPFIAILLSEVVSAKSKSELFQKRLGLWIGVVSSLLAIALFIAPFTQALPTGVVPPFAFFTSGAVFAVFSITIFRKSWPHQAFLHLVLLLGVLRLVYNICFLPIQAETSKSKYYAEEIDRIVEISEEGQVYWTGAPYIFKPEINVAGNQFFVDSLSTPPLIAYQIPYYYSLRTEELLLFEKNPKPGNWYLGEKGFAESFNSTISHEFEDKWMQRTIVLYQIQKP